MLLMRLKEALNLGVLQKQDMEAMTRILLDPESARSMVLAGTQGVDETSKIALKQAAEVRKGLEVARSTYAGGMSAVGSNKGPATQTKQVVRRGTWKGKPVVQYDDGTIEEQ
jgi:anthranilate phosphoribosyltransferase